MAISIKCPHCGRDISENTVVETSTITASINGKPQGEVKLITCPHCGKDFEPEKP